MDRLRTILAVFVVSAFASSCSSAPDGEPDETSLDHFGYQVPVKLSTTNAGSSVGASEFAQTLSGRLYPGVFVPGPSGQMIPNTDLIHAQSLPGAQRSVAYTISDQAVFSDGAPVTCSDYLLTFKAGQHSDIFESHMPVYSEVDSMNCLPGSKQFNIVFKAGQGVGARWRNLFAAGTVLPAHAVARELETDLAALGEDLQSDNPIALEPIANVWKTDFDLDNFNPDMQVSFGPFKIESVGDSGEVILVANDTYYGDAPLIEKIVVWPGTVDSAALKESGSLKIAELAEPSPVWLDPNEESNSLDVTSVVGQLTESLTFESAGQWSDSANRRALARCIDTQAVADASSARGGVETPVVTVHVVEHDDPLARRFEDLVESFYSFEVEDGSRLSGLELRIGYAAPSARMAAMVEAIRVACEPEGITIVDATEDGKTLANLGRIEVGQWGESKEVEGEIDAMLRPIDPNAEYAAPGNRPQDLESLRNMERALWEELPSLPLVAQPRSFAVDRNLSNVDIYTGSAGIGWNMDRWYFTPQPAATMGRANRGL